MIPEPVQPELASIRVTVRVVVLAVATITVAAFTVNTVVHRGSVDGVPIGLLLADGLTLVALRLGRRTVASWLGLAALLCLIGAAVVGLPESLDAANTSNVVFVTTYLGICVLSPRLGAAWIALMAGLWVVRAPAATLPVAIGGSAVNARWLGLVQLVVSGVWLWVVWQRELARAARRDATARESERSLVGSTAIQERIRVWRDGVVHTHETVLNDIRYVLDAPTVDRRRLAGLLAAHDPGGGFADGPEVTLGAVVDEVAAAEGADVADLGAAALAVLTAERAGALRAACTEVVRNLRRHAGARSVALSAFADAGRVTVRVTHDGSDGRTGAPAGIGRRVVLEESLDGVGGRVREGSGRVDLTVPTAPATAVEPTVEPSDTGRVVLSAVLAGNAVGGVPFAVVFALTAGPVAVAMGLANLVTVLIGARAAVRRATVPTSLVAVVALVGAVVPLAVAGFETCDESHLGVMVAVLTGFGATATIVWADRARWWWSAVGWTVAMVVLVVTIPADCAQQSAAAIVAGLAPPVFMVVVFLALGRAARATERIRTLQRDSAAARARAEAAVELSTRLRDSVSEASALMAEVAAGGTLDPATRVRLRCLDGLIRATIQFDPKTSGAVAGAGYTLVAAAAERGSPVRVLHLRDSGDARPLDPAVLADLDRLLEHDDSGAAVIQVLTSPGEDVLVVSTTVGAARRAGLCDRADRRFPGGSLSVDCDPTTDLAVAMVRRTAAPL